MNQGTVRILGIKNMVPKERVKSVLKAQSTIDDNTPIERLITRSPKFSLHPSCTNEPIATPRVCGLICGFAFQEVINACHNCYGYLTVMDPFLIFFSFGPLTSSWLSFKIEACCILYAIIEHGKCPQYYKSAQKECKQLKLVKPNTTI